MTTIAFSPDFNSFLDEVPAKIGRLTLSFSVCVRPCVWQNLYERGCSLWEIAKLGRVIDYSYWVAQTSAHPSSYPPQWFSAFFSDETFGHYFVYQIPHDCNNEHYS